MAAERMRSLNCAAYTPDDILVPKEKLFRVTVGKAVGVPLAKKEPFKYNCTLPEKYEAAILLMPVAMLPLTTELAPAATVKNWILFGAVPTNKINLLSVVPSSLWIIAFVSAIFLKSTSA
jgi:hypothetical protein